MGKSITILQKKYLKNLEDMEGNKFDYSRLVYKSSDKKYFDLTLSSFYLKLINGNIDINVVKLNMKEFKKEINRLEKKKTKKVS